MPHEPRRFPTRKQIADRVREAREAVRPAMTRKDLAAKAGIPIWAYYKKEKGRSPFDTDELSRLAGALDAPYLWPLVSWREGMMIERLGSRDT